MIQRKCLDEHQKTATCKQKGLLLDKTPKEHYYEKNKTQETQQNVMKVPNANTALQKQKVMKLMNRLGLS